MKIPSIKIRIVLFLSIFCIMLFLVVYATGVLNIFHPSIIFIYGFVYIIGGYQFFFVSTNPKFIFYEMLYVIVLFATLFLRTTTWELSEQFNFDIHYLVDWIPLLFRNSIVTFNVFGNVLLFVPLGYFLKQYINAYQSIYMGMFVIILLELTQVVSKLGVFDFGDIILNGVGLGIGVFFSVMLKRSYNHG